MIIKRLTHQRINGLICVVHLRFYGKKCFECMQPMFRLKVEQEKPREKKAFPLPQLASSPPSMVYANEMTICIDIIR